MPPKSKADIRGLDPAALLIPRSMAGRILGGKSIAFIKRLERDGMLTPVRLKDSTSAQVFYRRDEVLALAQVPGAAHG